jgi:Protein kinase domain
VKISARYEVLGLLGQGGMGVVYHVRDTTRGRENALKTLAPGRSEDIVERFLTEAQVMFRLEHDNIVRVYDFGKDGETYFLTMELIKGKNLRQLLNARHNQGFPLAEVVRMGIETADALNYAHSQKPEAVVHRDIKPVNIMIEEETGRVVVTDFGIAKLMADTGGDAQAASDLSRTVFAGTVPYSAPEQFLQAGPTRRLDARVDIYALGIVLYEIYTGRHFFTGLSADEVELHHRSIESGECPVKSPHACDHKVTLPDTPAAFVRIVEKAIARDRNERYRTAAHLLADLQACAAAESVQACESARLAAEAAGAPEASPTDFRRGGELEQEARAAEEKGDHGKAGDLFRNAMLAFRAAEAKVGERRAQQAVQEAKAAMQIVAQEATEGEVGRLAPEAMKQAAEFVAAADASEAQGQFEPAATLYRQAEEAFRAALASARQATARKAIEDELPTLRAAREAAEQADAATFATDAFAAAVREQVHLDEALAAGELTRVRDLLPKVREGFANAGAEAVRRLAQSVDEARTTMRAAAAEAHAAGAPTNAKAEFIEAESLAGAAEKLAERGELDLAVAQLGRASDAYRTAVAAAERAGERLVLEQEIPAIRAARADAEGAGAPDLAADAYTAAAADQAALEAALAAGDLTRVRTLLPKVGEGFAAAKTAALLAQASRAALAARAAMERAREAALAAGAERYVPDALSKARARERDGTSAEDRRQWERAEQLHLQTATAYEEVRTAALRRAEEQRLASELAEHRSAMEAARTRAKNAGAAQNAEALYREASALAKEAGAASNDAAGMAASIAAYTHAVERYDAATAEAERVARRSELKETLAAVEEAKQQALDAGAGRNPQFAAADDELAAAQRALAADELSLVVSSATAARERFTAAKTSIEQAKAETAADAALAEVAAHHAEAREAGAETIAPKAWAEATQHQKLALSRRHEGDCDQVMALAAAATRAFAAALDETVAAAQASAVAAKSAAELAGRDDNATAAADKSYATAEQRRSEGKLVSAVVAFRKATEGYTTAREARAAAAKQAESVAQAARSEATKAETATLAAEDHRNATAAFERAAAALAAGSHADAEKSFEEAARGFRAGVAIAARERARAAARAAREAAASARERANEAGAAELAAAELKRADDAFGAGERALEAENYAASEADFAKARAAFEGSREAAVRAALERQVKDVRARAERLRTERAAGAPGFFLRRKLAKVDAVLARGTAAAASGDFSAANEAFSEAIPLIEALPVPPPPVAPPAPAKAPAKAPTKTPDQKRAKSAPPQKPPHRDDDTTTIAGVSTLKGATVVAAAPSLEGATIVAAAPSLEGATVMAAAPSLEGATVVARSAVSESPTTLGQAAPEPRGLPIAWIGAAAAGVVLLAGVWLLRGRGTSPSISEPSVVAKKSDVTSTEKKEVPPPVAKPTVVAREPEPPAATAVTQVAKVEEPPPPAPPVPRIASFAPEDEHVEPAEDAQKFRIALAEPAGATYTWSVDGKVLSDATQASATIAAKQDSQRVEVVAHTAGGEARHAWELAALAPPPPPVAPVAPVISGFEPRDKTLQIPPGKSQRFRVQAKSDDGAPLRYAWSVDGKVVGSNVPLFNFSPEDDDEGTTHQIRAEVSSRGGPSTQSEWTVTVPRGPVTIARQAPAPTDIVADVGDSTDFSVEARAGRTGEALSYTWSVNRRRAEDANGPRFTYRPDRAGTADIEVRVDAPDRAAAVRRWTVKAREAKPEPVPTQVAAVRPRVEPTLAVRGDAKREIESWIAAYRAAYEQKDVDKLVALGVISSDKRGALKSALNDLDQLTVKIGTSSISIEGPDSAVVTLTREDSYNARGARRSQSIDIKKTLRKTSGGWVAQ